MGPIAITGMACRFGGAVDLQAYWDMCVEGRDAFGPVPPDRWAAEAFYSPSHRATDKSYAPAGAWIDEVRGFPALALGLPPRRVEVMDPQQRLALEMALHAIEDAGLAGRMPARTGVFLGVTGLEFRDLLLTRIMAQLMATGALGEAPADAEAFLRVVERVVPSRPFSAPGVLANMVAAVVAQELDLSGPAYTVDAACASAMIAVSDAVDKLRNGAVDMALAGGVYLCLTPAHHVAFSRIGAMSPTGRCLPFDARADGFVQGDGAGVLLLERLEDAEAAGRRIYAVIEGIAINNDGHGDGPMAPLASGQAAVIREAWTQAGMDPATLGYLEAHGTGTEVGDLVELNGLQASVGAQAHRVVLGSSKANVGHTMSAAGAAGLIRAALATWHGRLPPMAGFEGAREDLPLGPFRLTRQAEDWAPGPRVAGVSSFGFGGTNGHAVLRGVEVGSPAAARAELVCLSAGTEEELRELARRGARLAAEDPRIGPGEVARAWAGRPALGVRVPLVVADRAGLIAGLEGVADASISPTRSGDPPRMAWLFPGQGAQRVGMLRGIRARFPVVASTLVELGAALEGELDLPLEALLYPELRAEVVSPEQALAELTATERCQPALLAAGVALARLLQSVGLSPVVVAGHSLGEFTAAAVAGVLTAQDAARFVSRRGQAMGALPGDPGAMVAIQDSPEVARGLLVEGAVIANTNHPRQVVVSGFTPAVDAVAERAAAAKVRHTRLRVSHGFHSPAMEALVQADLVAGLAMRDPEIPVASAISGKLYGGPEEAREVFARHPTSPVDFPAALKLCLEAGADLFLQVGAGGPLLSFARGSLPRGRVRGVLGLASTEDEDGGASLLATLGRLWAMGAPVDLTVLAGPGPLASLPPSRLPREEYWLVKERAQLPIRMPARVAAPAVEQPVSVEVEATDDGVAARAIAVLARVSAYPREAIRPELALLGDLGFDSLMLNDLLAGLSEAFPGMAPLPAELIARGPTVGEILAHVGRKGELDLGADELPLDRYRLGWQARPLPVLPERRVPSAPRVGQVGPIPAGLRSLLPASSAWTGPLDLLVWALPAGPSIEAWLAGELPWPDPSAPLLEALAMQDRLGARPDLMLLVPDGDPWAEGPAGVARSIGREWGVRAKVLHLAGEIDGGALLAEWTSADESVDLRLGPGLREVRALVAAEPSGENFEARPGDRALVTGGTRGIGLQLAALLAEEGCQVTLVGRSAPGPDAAALIAASSGRVTSVEADLARPGALELVAPGPFEILVHAAGLLADGPVGGIDPEQVRQLRAVKVEGWRAARGVAGTALRRAIVIGSWAGRFGNRHQAAYAGANAELAALASLDPAAVVLETGPWTGSAMAAAIPAPILAAMRAEGVDLVGQTAGRLLLEQTLSQGQGLVVAGRELAAGRGGAQVRLLLSPETHPYLLDHQIEGRPVLPMAVVADLMAWVAGLAPPFALEGLERIQGVVIEGPTEILIRVQADRVELRVGSPPRLAWRARLGELAPVVDPGPAEGGEAPVLSLTDFYRGITFHGPLLRGIHAIEGSKGEGRAGFVRGRVRTGRPGDWIPGEARSAWTLDPLALDSLLQLSAWLAWTRFGRAGTPSGLGRLTLLRPWPTGELVAEVWPEAGEGDAFSATLALRDADGLVALVEGATAALISVGRPPEEIGAWPEVVELEQRLEAADALGLNPYFAVHEGTARDSSVVAGRSLLNFSSYNYLGLSGDRRVIDAVKEAVDRYGTSVSASRLASGERPFHAALEAALARAQGAEDAILFTAGHATNVTTIGHLMGPDDLVLHDELIHDSALQGIKLSGASRRAFPHEDPAWLDRWLSEHRGHHRRALIVVEGVYSMDGDLCRLPEWVALKRRHGCLLMVDEAHSFGVIGATGHGVGEHWGVEGGAVDLWMGTLSKSLASCGGWIAGKAELIRYLRYTAPGFVYSAGLTAANGVAALRSLELMEEEPWRVRRLLDNARRFHAALLAHGLDVGPARGESGVIPVITGDSMVAMRLAKRLLERGINVQPIVYPAVAEAAARLRFFLSSTHCPVLLERAAKEVAVALVEARGRPGP